MLCSKQNYRRFCVVLSKFHVLKRYRRIFFHSRREKSQLLFNCAYLYFLTSTVIGWFLVTCPWSNSNVSWPENSSCGSTLICNPINRSKTVCRVVISSCSSDTGCKLSCVNAFNPSCNSFVNKRSIRIIDMVNCELHVYFTVWVEHEPLKVKSLALILCPNWNVLEFVSPCLKRKTYNENVKAGKWNVW